MPEQHLQNYKRGMLRRSHCRLQLQEPRPDRLVHDESYRCVRSPRSPRLPIHRFIPLPAPPPSDSSDNGNDDDDEDQDNRIASPLLAPSPESSDNGNGNDDNDDQIATHADFATHSGSPSPPGPPVLSAAPAGPPSPPSGAKPIYNDELTAAEPPPPSLDQSSPINSTTAGLSRSRTFRSLSESTRRLNRFMARLASRRRSAGDVPSADDSASTCTIKQSSQRPAPLKRLLSSFMPVLTAWERRLGEGARVV